MKRYSSILSIVLFSFLFLGHAAQAALPFSDCVSQDKVPPAECQALVDLYNSTNGPGWSDNTGWLSDYYVCEWYGVACTSPSEGNVTGVYLTNNQLTGSIPSSIGNLTILTSLHLARNQLNGSIPPEIWGMNNLTVLNLGTNQFSGSIPSAISNLTNLVSLALDNNRLNGSIPPSIGNLAHLDEMYLDNNQLCGRIPSTLTNIPLTALQLGYNYLYTHDPALIDFINLYAEADWMKTQGAWQPVCGFPWTMFLPAITEHSEISVTGYWKTYHTNTGQVAEDGPEFIELVDSNGQISGQFKCGDSSSITGQRVDDHLSLVFHFSTPVTLTGTVSGNKASGTWVDRNGDNGTWRADKISSLDCQSQ